MKFLALSSHSQNVKCIWNALYSWPQTSNFQANFISMYKSSKFEAGMRIEVKIWVGARVKIPETVKIEVKVLLFLMKAFEISLASSSLSIKRWLRWIRNLSVWLAAWVDFKGDYNFCFSKETG